MFDSETIEKLVVSAKRGQAKTQEDIPKYSSLYTHYPRLYLDIMRLLPAQDSATCKTPKRVRFSLFNTEVQLPFDEHEAAVSSRNGNWDMAPFEDELWNGWEQTFRTETEPKNKTQVSDCLTSPLKSEIIDHARLNTRKRY